MDLLAELLIWHLLGVFLSSGFGSVLVESFLDTFLVHLDSTLLPKISRREQDSRHANTTHDNSALSQLLVKIAHSSFIKSHLLFDIKYLLHDNVKLGQRLYVLLGRGNNELKANRAPTFFASSSSMRSAIDTPMLVIQPPAPL